ncbi:MAG TPA: ABC transporter substrate-binding protein [Methylomirabilota bacterium]|nr:ABC transporter substrate-binding protein [Methylomirabilota bacterium]
MIRAMAVVLVLSVATAPVVIAAPMLADVHARLDRIVELLRQPGLSREQRREAVRAEAEPAFDWDGMARAALGPAWRERTPAERATFTRLFRSLVEDAYLARILDYHDERIVYGRETLSGGEALLQTRIVRSGFPATSVDYELSRLGGRWLVDDVLIEHVSLVQNYHSQIAAILGRSSYSHLIATMRDRIAALG